MRNFTYNKHNSDIVRYKETVYWWNITDNDECDDGSGWEVVLGKKMMMITTKKTTTRKPHL